MENNLALWWSAPRPVNVLRYQKNQSKRAGMKALLGVGKALALAFWLVFGAALAKRFGAPFEQLVYLLGAFLALLHGAQLWLFSDLLSGRASPWLDRVQILLFGIFHLYPLKAERAGESLAAAHEEAAHA